MKNKKHKHAATVEPRDSAFTSIQQDLNPRIEVCSPAPILSAMDARRCRRWSGQCRHRCGSCRIRTCDAQIKSLPFYLAELTILVLRAGDRNRTCVIANLQAWCSSHRELHRRGRGWSRTTRLLIYSQCHCRCITPLVRHLGVKPSTQGLGGQETHSAYVPRGSHRDRTCLGFRPWRV